MESASHTRPFGAVAYWSADPLPDDWGARFIQAVAPVVEAGVISVEQARLKGGSIVLAVRYSGSEAAIELRSKAGRGRGLVPDTADAIVFLLCLMAWRREVPSVSLADDAQSEVPQRVFPSYRPFGRDWQRTVTLSQLLGFMPGQQFYENEGQILSLAF
jgi:hypothetical protein